MDANQAVDNSGDRAQPEFLTVSEAAVLLRVADQTVRNELAARRLPGKKIGKEWRLSRTALIAYLSTPGTPRATRPKDGDGR